MKQYEVTAEVEKIVYGGQGLATLEDGKKLFVWGALPGETVRVLVTKSKKSWAEGVVEEVITKSKDRVEPRDPESYLSTSPWQIFDYRYENSLKKELVVDQFAQHGVTVTLDDFTAPEEPYHYRNKVEFSFWWSRPDLSTSPDGSAQDGDDAGQLDFAFFKRGTHTRQPVDGSSLAHPCINEAAVRIRNHLREQGIQARTLKTLLIRCNQAGGVIAELYVKEKAFNLKTNHEELGIEGFSIHFSNPQSPASVKTKTLHVSGKTQLTDTINSKSYTYAVSGFFQVTIPMYEAALLAMKQFVDPTKPLLDMYSGVGSIGLSLANDNQKLTLVEIDERCVAEAKNNAEAIKPDTKIIFASSENALEHITGDETVIVDPPRVGLHEKVIQRLLETKPATIVYLSCNPATQARDVALLQDTFEISYVHGFNFFPRTPHIENLVVLRAKT